MKAIPVFIPKYSLYFPHSSHEGRPSMILNPFKTGNTPQHIDPHLHNGSLTNTSADTVNSSIIKSKREGWGALDIGPQSKKVKFQMDEKERNSSSTSIFDLPSENAAVSRSERSIQFPFTSSDQSGTLVQANERSLNKAYDDDDGAMDGIHRYGSQLSKESSVSPYPKEETQGKANIEDYTQFACHQPIQMSTIKDYSGFLSTETSTHSEKQAMQSSLVKEENTENMVNLIPASIEEREEGEISSCDSLPGDLDSENGIVEVSDTNLSNDKTVNLKSHSMGSSKKGETTLLANHSTNSSSTINSDTKKWPNDLFESYSDQSPSNQKHSKFENSSSRDTGNSRYDNHQTNSSDTDDTDDTGEKDNEEKDDFAHSSDDDNDDDSEYRYQHRHQHRHRYRDDHEYERDQQSRRHDSRSYYSKDRHSIEEEEESTSQSDSEEENSMLEKLRKVSHLWRKKERWLSKLPSEEGEVPIENVKKSFFIKEGIDLMSSSSVTHSS